MLLLMPNTNGQRPAGAVGIIMKCVPRTPLAVQGLHSRAEGNRSGVSSHRVHCPSDSPVSPHRAHCLSDSPVSPHCAHCLSDSPVSPHRAHCLSDSLVSPHCAHCLSDSPVSPHSEHCPSDSPISQSALCSLSVRLANQSVHTLLTVCQSACLSVICLCD